MAELERRVAELAQWRQPLAREQHEMPRVQEGHAPVSALQVPVATTVSTSARNEKKQILLPSAEEILADPLLAVPEADRHFGASMAQILRDTNTKVPKWPNNMETSSRQGYETPTKAPAPSERRAELARVLVLSGELKHQPACLGAYTLVAGRAVHGRPVWRHERGDRCIAKLASGKWAVQKEENVGVNGLCFLRVFDANVLFPHQSPVAWEEWGGKGGWPAEAGLKCDADPPPATTSTARTPGRVGSGGQTAPVQRQGRPVQPPSFGRGQANKQARRGQFSSLEDIGRATGDFLYNSALAAQYMAQLEAQARREAQAQHMARREAQAEREARASYGGTDHLQVVHSFKAPSTTAFLTLRTSHRAGGATR